MHAGEEGDVLGLADPVTRIVAGLDAWALRRVLLGLAAQFPRTLEGLLQHGLTPALAELLTQRFEAADAALAAKGAPLQQPSLHA
jgi:hypothetical protein